ncbi:MAG TPA: peptidase MA family metallohydrolase, partial [Dehalococcoidia bacterium]|nr:peptidase MA family metallohydrolase [Dehalococcoidia bacterium]
AAAQVAPTVTDKGVEDRFPEGMVFHVIAQSDSPIEKVRLRYTILPDGTAATAQVDFQPGASVAASFTLSGNDPPRIYLPPGTVIQYSWQVTDADGDTTSTEPATFFYEDARFHWTHVESGGVTVYYYSGSEADAREMLDVAAQTIASMSGLLGASIDFPVKVWAYDSVQDMRPALARRSDTYEQSVITAGVRVASDTVLVLGNVAFDTLRHELTHVVTGVAGEGSFAALPAWLDEGTAVYGQKDPDGFRDAVERAVARRSVLSVRSISSPPGEPDKVNLFYGEAWSLVSFLVDTHGPEKFAQLFAAIKSGKTTDEALTAVYGFDQDGLENAWRASHALPPREPAPANGQQPQATPGGSQAPAASGTGDGGGASIGLILGLIAGMLALAAAVGAAGWALARRLR